MTMRHVRYTDRELESYWGPFTWVKKRPSWERRWCLYITSGKEEQDDWQNGCYLNLGFGSRNLLIALPQVVKAHRTWVEATYSPNPDFKGYWDVHEKDYGFSYSEGFLQIFLGPQTMDSSTTKSKSWFLPWLQWRLVRKTLYRPDWSHFYTKIIRRSSEDRPWLSFNDYSEAKKQVPAKFFRFLDYDGEPMMVKCVVQEWEWKAGEGWFKWLSLFRKSKIRRSLDLSFSGETGDRKGSWKGGTVGTSIDMKRGQSCESAFILYCESQTSRKQKMTFVGEVEVPTATRESSEAQVDTQEK